MTTEPPAARDHPARPADPIRLLIRSLGSADSATTSTQRCQHPPDRQPRPQTPVRQPELQPSPAVLEGLQVRVWVGPSAPAPSWRRLIRRRRTVVRDTGRFAGRSAERLREIEEFEEGRVAEREDMCDPGVGGREDHDRVGVMNVVWAALVHGDRGLPVKSRRPASPRRCEGTAARRCPDPVEPGHTAGRAGSAKSGSCPNPTARQKRRSSLLRRVLERYRHPPRVPIRRMICMDELSAQEEGRR
jgi:hypothetical protein